MMTSGEENITIGAVMATKGLKFGQLPTLVAGKKQLFLKVEGFV